MRLRIKNLTCGYRNKPTLCQVSFEVAEGELLSILGPNGVGKTTLFKTILGLIEALGGEIMIDQENIHALSPANLAKLIAYVPQSQYLPFPFRVIDIVVMGRLAHLGIFASPKQEDYTIADKILDKLGILALRDQRYSEISGGERQIVIIAKALVQQPRFIIMDEPTSNLDLGNQMKVLSEIQKLKQEGIGVIMTTHYPNHAFLLTSKTILIKKSKQILYGSCEEILTKENIDSAYGVESMVTTIRDIKGSTYKICVPLLS